MIKDIEDIRGKTVWTPIATQKLATRACPICFGKGRVTLILGNGDSCILPCDYCGKGHDVALGTVDEYDFVCDAYSVYVQYVSIRNKGADDEEISLQEASGRCTYAKNAFLTKEEALSAAQAIKEKNEQEEIRRISFLKKDKKKSFSWNAGYYLRQINDLKKEIALNERKVIYCKARSKKDDNTV